MNIKGVMLVTRDPALHHRIEGQAQALGIDTLQLVSSATEIRCLVETSRSNLLIIDSKGLDEDEVSTSTDLIETASEHDLCVVSLGDSGHSLSKAIRDLQLIPRHAPLARILKEAERSLRFELEIWGARGTLPVSGRRALKYGGNTSCVSLRIGRDHHFIFDAGTGLKRLSRHLMKQDQGRFNGRIFITHPHWDHLNCIPFFEPLYHPENKIDLMGPGHEASSFRELLEGQMNGVYFPIKPDKFRAEVTFTDMIEGNHRFDNVVVKAFRLDHPGYCLGYRIQHLGSSFAYITDNEISDDHQSSGSNDALVEFLKDVDLLIHDASYFDDEYPAKTRWGHSAVGKVVDLALTSRAKHLLLFHHDPDHDDADIDAKLIEARRQILFRNENLDCHNAREGDRWDLRSGRLQGRIR